jgi:hypothetical protein
MDGILRLNIILDLSLHIQIAHMVKSILSLQLAPFTLHVSAIFILYDFRCYFISRSKLLLVIACDRYCFI